MENNMKTIKPGEDNNHRSLASCTSKSTMVLVMYILHYDLTAIVAYLILCINSIVLEIAQ